MPTRHLSRRSSSSAERAMASAIAFTSSGTCKPAPNCSTKLPMFVSGETRTGSPAAIASRIGRGGASVPRLSDNPQSNRVLWARTFVYSLCETFYEKVQALLVDVVSAEEKQL